MTAKKAVKMDQEEFVNRKFQARVYAAARVLCKKTAQACGTNEEDEWKQYESEYTSDALDMLRAADGVVAGVMSDNYIKQIAEGYEKSIADSGNKVYRVIERHDYLMFSRTLLAQAVSIGLVR